MAVKPGTGGGDDFDGGGGNVPLNAEQPYLRETYGPLTVSTGRLRGGARRYGHYADNLKIFSAQHGHLREKPLKDDDTDETWRQFAPTWYAGQKVFVVTDMIGNALSGIEDALVNLAETHERTEDDAIDLGRNTFKSVAPPPGGNGDGNGDGGSGSGTHPLQSAFTRKTHYVDPSGNPVPMVKGSGMHPLVPSGHVKPGVVPDGKLTGTVPDGTVVGPDTGSTAPDRAPVPQHANAIRSDVGIPLVPQELVNASGERIGVLAPWGATVPGDQTTRLTLLGPDGRPEGFFQPYGRHTFGEAVEGEMTPARTRPATRD
ncbi:hypothetical protein ACQPYE_17385 [Actinosynnema sp. CA-299493]